MTDRFGRRFALLLVALAMIAVASCKGGGVTPIKTLLDDPSRFDKKIVRVAGSVEESAGVLGYGAYRVNDGTGTISVVTSTNGSPRTGAQVGVEGEFRSAFTLGSQSLAAIQEHRRFTPK
jgi:hypothetical protein